MRYQRVNVLRGLPVYMFQKTPLSSLPQVWFVDLRSNSSKKSALFITLGSALLRVQKVKRKKKLLLSREFSHFLFDLLDTILDPFTQPINLENATRG